MSSNLCNACGHEHQGAALESETHEVRGQYSALNPENPCFVTQRESEEAIRDEELDEVLRLLRRHDADQVRGITPPTMAELIGALERGEHHR